MIKKNLKSRFIYYCDKIWYNYIRLAPALILELICLNAVKGEIRRGIRIIDPEPATSEHSTFMIDAALALIAIYDKIRFKRVQNEISIIMYGRGGFPSVYYSTRKLCGVDLRFFYDPYNPELTVQLLAAAIVSAATCGHLMSHGIIRTSLNKDRFNDFCSKEARNFLKLFGVTSELWRGSNNKVSSLEKFCYATKIIYDALTSNPELEAELWRKAGRYHPEEDKLTR